MSKQWKTLFTVVICVALCLAMSLPSFAADKQLKIWFWERDNAMAASWHAAIETFKAAHPDVEVYSN